MEPNISTLTLGMVSHALTPRFCDDRNIMNPACADKAEQLQKMLETSSRLELPDLQIETGLSYLQKLAVKKPIITETFAPYAYTNALVNVRQEGLKYIGASEVMELGFPVSRHEVDMFLKRFKEHKEMLKIPVS